MNDGLRAQKPAPLSEVVGPQVGAATVGYVAAGAPLPVVPTLRGDDGVDGTIVSWLLKVALRQKEDEEKGRESGS